MGQAQISIPKVGTHEIGVREMGFDGLDSREVRVVECCAFESSFAQIGFGEIGSQKSASLSTTCLVDVAPNTNKWTSYLSRDNISWTSERCLRYFRFARHPAAIG